MGRTGGGGPFLFKKFNLLGRVGQYNFSVGGIWYIFRPFSQKKGCKLIFHLGGRRWAGGRLYLCLQVSTSFRHSALNVCNAWGLQRYLRWSFVPMDCVKSCRTCNWWVVSNLDMADAADCHICMHKSPIGSQYCSSPSTIQWCVACFAGYILGCFRFALLSQNIARMLRSLFSIVRNVSSVSMVSSI